MLHGPAVKSVFRFALPLIIGGVFQQMYNMADALIIGVFSGSHQLAAVGATQSAIFLVTVMAMGMNGAYTIVMAQHHGANDTKMVRVSLTSALQITGTCAVVLSVLGTVGARPLLSLLGTPPEIIEDAVLYMSICCAGIAGSFLYNCMSSMLQALGDSKTPLMFLILSSLMNIGLDILFVAGFGMAVAGVALATVISQCVSGVLCLLFFLRRHPGLRPSRADWRPNRQSLWAILRLGLPQTLRLFLLCIGEMAISRVMNGLGTSTVAAFTAGSKITQFATLAFGDFTQAFSVFTAQNKGAGNIRRIQTAFVRMGVIVVAISALAGAFLFIFGKYIAAWFLSPSDPYFAVVVAQAADYLRASAYFYPFLAAIWMYNNTLRGLSIVGVPMASGIIELFAKVIFSFVLAAAFGAGGVWYAAPIGWVLGLVPSAIYYHSGRAFRQSHKKTEKSG